jgi:hypothetical protein
MGERTDFLTDTSSLDAPAQTNPAAIAEDIELTRAEMSDTIDSIQHRLDLDRLSQQAISTANEVTGQAVQAATEVTEQARDAAKEVVAFTIDEAKSAVRELTGQATDAVRESTIGRVELMAANTRGTAQTVQADLWTTIKQNPVPAALAAIGIGWLWTRRATTVGHGGSATQGGSATSGDYGFDGRPLRYGAYGRGDTDEPGQTEQIGEQTRQMAEQVIGQVQQRAEQVQVRAGLLQERAGQIPVKASELPYQAKGFWHTIEQNPVAAGALGVVLGGVAGLMLPETRQEHQLMGETRDRVIGSVQDVVGQTAEKAQHIAKEAARTAVDEASAQGMIPTSGGESPVA